MNIISCVSSNWAIGNNNHLLYNIPSDMEYFKSMTLNRTVIMGRHTYESLKIKPLPNRNNVVLSSSCKYDGISICRNIEEVYRLIANIPTDDVFIIGGEDVYKSFIDDCSTAYITKVLDIRNADTFFPINLDDSNNWHLVQQSKIFEHNGLNYSFNVYRKDVL